MSIFFDESSILCDLDTMFSKADENGHFDVTGYNIDLLISLEYGLDEGYCEASDSFECRITAVGKQWWAEYKIEQERLNNLALHAVD